MILKVDDTYHRKVMNYLKKEPDFNLFIIGDIERYGYDNYFLDIWAGIDKNGRIEGVLLKYFESMNSDLIPNNSLLREFIGGSIFED